MDIEAHRDGDYLILTIDGETEQIYIGDSQDAPLDTESNDGEVTGED